MAIGNSSWNSSTDPVAAGAAGRVDPVAAGVADPVGLVGPGAPMVDLVGRTVGSVR